MLRNSAYQQPWPQPVELIFQVSRSPMRSDGKGEVDCPTPSEHPTTPTSSMSDDPVCSEIRLRTPSLHSITPLSSLSGTQVEQKTDGTGEYLNALSPRSTSPLSSLYQDLKEHQVGGLGEYLPTPLRCSIPSSPTLSQGLEQQQTDGPREYPPTPSRRSTSPMLYPSQDLEEKRVDLLDREIRAPSRQAMALSLPSSYVPVEQEAVYPGKVLETPTSIRLIKIHESRDKRSRIVCTMQSAELEDRPRYRALSYNWGSPVKVTGLEQSKLSSDGNQQMLCNGELIKITQNLQDAFLELRQSKFTDWLWVDAVCIDQTDSEEKVQQVSMMGRIYLTAMETIVWLGKDESGLEDVKWAINVMIPKMLQRGTLFLDSGPLQDTEFAKVLGTEDLVDRLGGIKTFLAKRHYFNRAWVVQELALASAISVCVGNHRVSWTDLSNLSVVLGKSPWNEALLAQLPEFHEDYAVTKAFFENLEALRDLISLKTSRHASQPTGELREIYSFLQARYGMESEMETAAAWITHLLSLVRNQESSEKRDKIYCILGVAALFSPKVGELNVTPDYSQSIEAVYTSLTETLILNSHYLSIIAQVGDIFSRQTLDLPSWVVDYSSGIAINPILDFDQDQNTHFDASLTSEMGPFPRVVEGTNLTLIGAKFDHLTNVSPAAVDQIFDDVFRFEDFLDFLADLDDCYNNGRPCTEIVWRVMMMDSKETVNDLTTPPSSIARGFQAWIINMIGLWVTKAIQTGTGADSANESARKFFTLLYPDTPIEVPEEVEGDDEAFTSYYRNRMLPFVQAVRGRVHGRKFFKTQNNHFGMGSRSIQPDDQIWLIHDSKTPLILRPKPDSHEFLLVGEAYLHGFMHGEMLDDRFELEKRIGPVTIV